MKTRDWFLFWLLGIIWGTSFLWIKIAVQEISPLVLVGFRALFGALGILVILLVSKNQDFSWSVIKPNLFNFFILGLVNIALPRVRDFRGLNPNGFDGRGNYSIGLAEQSVFPEINPAKVEAQQGMNITFVTTARTDEEARRLLALFGMPFRSQTAGATG